MFTINNNGVSLTISTNLERKKNLILAHIEDQLNEMIMQLEIYANADVCYKNASTVKIALTVECQGSKGNCQILSNREVDLGLAKVIPNKKTCEKC